MKRNLVLAILLAALAAGAWWWLGSRPSERAAEAAPVAQVRVAPLRLQPISRTLRAFGVVEPSASGTQVVSLAYDCIVREVSAPVGSGVKAGDLLFVADPAPEARLELEDAREAREFAEKNVEAARQRYELKLATVDEFRAAEQSAEDARQKLESLQQRGLGGTNRVTARAPGMVLKLDAQPGSVVPAGTPILILGDSNHLQARLGVEADAAPSLLAGQPVTLTAVDRPSSAMVAATIGTVGAAVDTGTGELAVLVPLKAGGDWLPGEHVRCEIVLETKTALVAPRNAVLPDGDSQALYTVVGRKAVKHTVRPGISSGDVVEVIGTGLGEGDLVVVEGNYELEDGMEVVVPQEAGAKP